MGVVFKTFGHFIPDKKVTNQELAKQFDITEDWILERTGIIERRYFEGGATSDMIVLAAHNCLRQTEIKPEHIDCNTVADFRRNMKC